jgi:hypothetical protein
MSRLCMYNTTNLHLLKAIRADVIHLTYDFLRDIRVFVCLASLLTPVL